MSVIIDATGGKVVESVTALDVTGRNGRELEHKGPEAYRGITVADFPNSSCCSARTRASATVRWCS